MYLCTAIKRTSVDRNAEQQLNQAARMVEW